MKISKALWTTFVIIALVQSVRAQRGDRADVWNSGFSKAISGEALTYTSAFPDYVNQALLTRTTDGQMAITWQTGKASNPKNGYYYFRWVAAHSSGTSGGDRNFDFYINGKKQLTVTTLPKNQRPNWNFANVDSVKLSFVKVRSDAANDAHGFAYLRVPERLVQANQPLTLKLVGQKQGSADWMMTFKYDFAQKADLALFPFLYRNGKQPLRINVLHFGKTEKLSVRVNKGKAYKFSLKDGMNSFEVPVSPVAQPDSLHVYAKFGKTVLADQKLLIKPIVKREIDFIHHAHTDIGYSHLQPEVERIHTRNIYDALLMVEKTKNYPVEARFKWNVESLWAVENFMRVANATDKQRFITAVKNGDIGISALYANLLTGLSIGEEMLHYTDYAQKLKQEYQLPLQSAMMSDIPGFNWAMVTAMAKGGVKYFSSGPNYLGTNNPYLGDRVGEFVRAWGDKPVYWQSPSGTEKLLYWAGGRGYSSWHGNPPGAIFDNGAKKIAQYMDELAEKKYPYEMVQWRYNCVSDNGPIDTTLSDFVKQWNEKYSTPKIVLNTVTKLFEDFEQKYGATLPTVKGDVTPYWEDGAASTAKEEGLNRSNALKLQQLTTLYSMLSPKQYQPEAFYQAWRSILLFHEHTWGAHNSIVAPDSPFVTEQWRIKKEFLTTGDAQLHALENPLLGNFNNINAGFSVANTLSWKRCGPVYLPANFTANAVTDAFGAQYPLQKLADGRKLFIAKNLAPLSITFFRPSTMKRYPRTQLALKDTVLSNGLLTLVLDNKSGNIKQLQNIEGYSFANGNDTTGLNTYLFVPGRDPKDAQVSGRATKRVLEAGPYLIKLKYTAKAPGATQISKTISLFAADDKVYIDNEIDKTKALDKEALYYSFPFANGLSTFSTDGGFGAVTYADQLAGSNHDYFPVRQWIDLADRNKGVQLMMIEPFLASPKMVDERLRIGEYKKWEDTTAVSSNWFVYAMNNYWHTNFKISQEGPASFSMALRPHGLVKNAEQEHAAMEFNQPLILVNAQPGVNKSLLALSNNQIVVTSITPQSDKQFLVRLYNASHLPQQTQINWGALSPVAIKFVGTGQALQVNQELGLPGFETQDILVTVK